MCCDNFNDTSVYNIKSLTRHDFRTFVFAIKHKRIYCHHTNLRTVKTEIINTDFVSIKIE